MSEKQHPILIIGVGHQFRGDDAVGLIVAQRLRAVCPRGVTIVEAQTDGAALMEMWAEADEVILIDAVQSGARPGTLHRFNAHQQPMPVHCFGCSTHGFNVAEAIELARTLDRLPPRLIVYGIEGATFEIGQAVSPAVLASAEELAERLADELIGR